MREAATAHPSTFRLPDMRLPAWSSWANRLFLFILIVPSTWWLATTALVLPGHKIPEPLKIVRRQPNLVVNECCPGGDSDGGGDLPAGVGCRRHTAAEEGGGPAVPPTADSNRPLRANIGSRRRNLRR